MSDYRYCDKCGCRTNARLRMCCDAGRLADFAAGQARIGATGSMQYHQSPLPMPVIAGIPIKGNAYDDSVNRRKTTDEGSYEQD